MKTLGNIILVALLVEFVITVKGDGHWGYPDLENNEASSVSTVRRIVKEASYVRRGNPVDVAAQFTTGAGQHLLLFTDFPEWDGLCNQGKYQSPIDLPTKEAIKGVYEDFVFEDYDQPLKNSKIINTGHSAQIIFDEPKPTVSGGGLKGEYALEQIHFHWFSEHTIDRRRYILEAHLVHFNVEYSNISEAVKHKDGIAVLGVLFHDSTDENDILDPIVDNLGKISPPDAVHISIEIDDIVPSSLLPSNPSKDYFRYQGSLTTPTCDESVIWTVYLRSKPISQDQVKKFTQLEIGGGKKLKNNYRNIKAASGRALILVSDWDWIDDDDTESSAFSMHLLSASFLPARLFSLFLLFKVSNLYLL